MSFNLFGPNKYVCTKSVKSNRLATADIDINGPVAVN